MIRVQDLVYTYQGATTPAVNHISFEIQSGEVFGFLGPSGAGKSTTQKILIKLLPHFNGEIEIMGKALQSWGSDFYEHVGVSFELPNHYQRLTALENLRLFRSLYSSQTEEPEDLLALVGLEEDGDTTVSAFSKGMQMRLNLIRALIHRPQLLFLDEPTTGLDPGNARKIKEIVLDFKKEGRTIFLTTHDMHVADELCDRVAFMVEGELVLIENPRRLKLEHGTHSVRVEYHQNGTTAEAEFPVQGIGKDEDFLTLIREHEVETIHTQEATLEDIFIQVTGRSLI